jgi:quercetin dioxygenase-like cupin family protein
MAMERIATMTRAVLFAGIIALCLATRGAAQSQTLQGVTYRSPSGTTLRLMLDESNVGSEVSVGEMIFPPNTDSGDHAHGAIEIFYVVSGELNHIVNGKSQILTPGMTGFVKPPDMVRHKTGPAGAKVAVIWVPGAEAGRIAARWKKEP